MWMCADVGTAVSMRALWPVVVLLVGCGPDSFAELDGAGDDDGLELVAGELNATSLLAFLNGPDATLAVLTNDVRIDARAARGIVAARAGADGSLGTADDVRFTSVAQVDAVAYVGAATLVKLDAWAATHGAATVTVDGVRFTSAEAALAVSVVNDSRLTSAGLSSTAVSNLIAGRPISTLDAVAKVTGVGASALTALRKYVQAQLSGVPAQVGCEAGSFDGVAFTKAEACHAVEFLNRARFSEMAALPDAARLIAYETGPDGVYSATRRSAWTSVADFANRPGIGATAVNGLKTGAAAWTVNGASADTIASTWANRTALVNLPVYVEKAYVTKTYPQTGEGGYLWECAELRDAPGATNFVLGCRPAVVCGGSCWSGVNVWVSRVHGSFRRSTMPGSGGYRISLSN